MQIVHKTCPIWPLCRDPNEGSEVVYLNMPRIQKLLGYKGFEYEGVNMQLNGLWAAGPDMNRPTSREMTRILNEGNIETLVLNGNLDAAWYILPFFFFPSLSFTFTMLNSFSNTPGQIMFFEELPWSGLAEYRKKEFKDWFWEDIDGSVLKGGQMKSVDRLYFVNVDGAGHTCPGDQKGAVQSVVNAFLPGRNSMERKGFFG
jgi:hypothetical protein